jgi:hypothetical protein
MMMQCLSHEEWFQKLFPDMAKANEDLKLHEATFLILVILFSKFQKVSTKKKKRPPNEGKKVFSIMVPPSYVPHAHLRKA